jgi:hypothetical protein
VTAQSNNSARSIRRASRDARRSRVRDDEWCVARAFDAELRSERG